ncbi:hypothetical protein O181_053084 [Austropuccinia psidii MF-1]|uniref:Uncharacterized protein n=1 Tax=Austropuccinia psidii MF-1 TaxID=1389203 RepID=A0A9Q3HSB3_9BASI|nr:hypothetical protein [Austropuccinia psidii MF-1]
MPSTRSGALSTASSSSQKGYRHDYVRRQTVSEGQGSVTESQTEKLGHSEADNTALPPMIADTTTRSPFRHIQSHKEGLQQCIAAQRVTDHSRSVEKLHEFLPDCEKTPRPSQHWKVTQLMEKKNMIILAEEWCKKTLHHPRKFQKAPIARSNISNVKKKPQAQKKGKGKEPATNLTARARESQKFIRMPWKMYLRWPEQ